MTQSSPQLCRFVEGSLSDWNVSRLDQEDYILQEIGWLSLNVSKSKGQMGKRSERVKYKVTFALWTSMTSLDFNDKFYVERQ